jgi:hypothetical protein
VRILLNASDGDDKDSAELVAKPSKFSNDTRFLSWPNRHFNITNERSLIHSLITSILVCNCHLLFRFNLLGVSAYLPWGELLRTVKQM